jgi:hypothetical protein
MDSSCCLERVAVAHQRLDGVIELLLTAQNLGGCHDRGGDAWQAGEALQGSWP